MCSISCIVNFKENFTKNTPYYRLLLKQITDSQGSPVRHEGFICEHTAISCTNEENVLSKICEGYQFIIAFDGYLSNTQSLKKELSSLGYCFTSDNDAELALNTYIHFGEKAPAKLSGIFSFIIYDTMRRQIFAVSDAFSDVPLFYTKLDSSYLFASQIRGIFAHPDSFAKISSRGLSQLLSFSKGISAEIFENIHILPPSHILKIKDGEFVLKKYSTPPITSTVDYENCENEFIDTLSQTLRNTLTENSAILHLGGMKDELLSLLSAKIQSENTNRLTEYAIGRQGLSKKYSALHEHIVFTEDSLLDSLKACVEICALPVVSGSDFLLPLIFERAKKSDSNILTALPDIPARYVSNSEILSSADIFHASVVETLDIPDEKESYIHLNSAHILANAYGINLKFPFLSKDVSDILNLMKAPQDELFSNCLKRLCGDSAGIVSNAENSSLNLKLKRILLDIIATDSSPILAFFDKCSLLRLCERGFDLSGGDISETELISYLIKLNLWFLKYRPVII